MMKLEFISVKCLQKAAAGSRLRWTLGLLVVAWGMGILGVSQGAWGQLDQPYPNQGFSQAPSQTRYHRGEALLKADLKAEGFRSQAAGSQSLGSQSLGSQSPWSSGSGQRPAARLAASNSPWSPPGRPWQGWAATESSTAATGPTTQLVRPAANQFPAPELSIDGPALDYVNDGPALDYVNLDEYPLVGGAAEFPHDLPRNQAYTHHVLADGLIYRAYLAGMKESRMAAHIHHEQDAGWLWDATLGSQVSIYRYGTANPIRPEGFEISVEGSAQVRLNLEEQMDVTATDYRVGVPFSWGNQRHQTKFGYYHISSHLGDEFLLKRPNFNRLNFARDALVLGHSIYLNPNLRIYGEAAWTFYSHFAKEWEFQFGLDYAPAYQTGFRGAPFFAVNTHLRQELDFGGNLTVQTGWAWRADRTGKLFRIGFHYYNGESNQYSFFDFHEQQLGAGIWYDF